MSKQRLYPLKDVEKHVYLATRDRRAAINLEIQKIPGGKFTRMFSEALAVVSNGADREIIKVALTAAFEFGAVSVGRALHYQTLERHRVKTPEEIDEIAKRKAENVKNNQQKKQRPIDNRPRIGDPSPYDTTPITGDSNASQNPV